MAAEIAEQKAAEARGQPQDYDVNVHIYEARCCHAPSKTNFADPIVEVWVGEEWKNGETKRFKKTGSAIWDKVFAWELQKSPADFFMSQIRIDVKDYRIFPFPNTLIGSVYIGIADVYQCEGHRYPMQWFPLRNPKSDDTIEVVGYVKARIHVLGQEDVTILDKKELPPDYTMEKLLRTPRIEAKKYNIKFKVLQCRGLKAADAAGTSDPYVKVTVSGVEQKTKVMAFTLEPVYEVALQLPVVEPMYCDTIDLSIFDADAVGPLSMGADDRLARKFFSWKSIKSNPKNYRRPQWYNMYTKQDPTLLQQAKNLVPNSIQEKLEFTEDKAEDTEYAGRILLAIEVEPTENPGALMSPLKHSECAPWMDPNKPDPFYTYVFTLEVYEGREIPTNTIYNHVQLEFLIGKDLAITEPKQVVDGVVNFNTTIYVDAQAMLLETDAQMHKDGKVPLSFPDVQIFLYKVFRGTNTDFARSRIGFYRQSANHFKQDFKNERWLELQSDSSCAIHPELGEVPGWLLVKFAAEKRDGGAQAKRQDYEKREAGKKLQAVMKNAEPYELRAYIFQARGLPINRKGEVPSTFVKVSLQDTVLKSHIVFESSSPIYDCKLHRQVSLPTRKVAGTQDEFDVDYMVATTPPLKVEIFDGQTLVGRAFIETKSDNVITKKDIESASDPNGPPATQKRIRAAQDKPPEPAWSELFSGGDVVGEVLIGFQLIEGLSIAKIPSFECEPHGLQDFIMELSVIGIRDLDFPTMFDLTWPDGGNLGMGNLIYDMAENAYGRRIASGLPKPRVFFDCGDPITYVKTKTCNKPSFQYPNFKEILELQVRLPRDKKYAPNIDIVVVEGGIAHMIAPKVLASASFSIEEYYEDWPESENQDSARRSANATMDDDEKVAVNTTNVESQKKESLAAKAISKFDGPDAETALLTEFQELMQSLRKQDKITDVEENKMLQKWVEEMDKPPNQQPIRAAFRQYIDAPRYNKFYRRVESFLAHKQSKRHMTVFGSATGGDGSDPDAGAAPAAGGGAPAANADDGAETKQWKGVSRPKELQAGEILKEFEYFDNEGLFQVRAKKHQRERDELGLDDPKREQDESESEGDEAEGDEGNPKSPTSPTSPDDEGSPGSPDERDEGEPDKNFSVRREQGRGRKNPGAGVGNQSEDDGNAEAEDKADQGESGRETSMSAQGPDVDGDHIEPDTKDNADAQKPGQDDGGNGGGGDEANSDSDKHSEGDAMEEDEGDQLPEEAQADAKEADGGDDEEGDANDDLQEPDLQKPLPPKPDAEMLALSAHGPKLSGTLEESDNYKDEIPFMTVFLCRGDEKVGRLKMRLRSFKYRHRKEILTKTPRPDLEDFLRESDIKVRLYVLRAHQLLPKDNEDSNPFLVLNLGTETKDCRDKNGIKWNNLNPEWYRSEEMTTRLPGESLLTVKIMHYNMLSSPDLLGFTKIDLEDRWFCEKWKKTRYKPIEMREIKKDEYQPQGHLEMWLDMVDHLDALKPAYKLYKIKELERRPVKFELRVIIWYVKDAKSPSNDTTTDQYVECELTRKTQCTDVHKKVPQRKTGEFNYRLIFTDVEYPNKKKNYSLKFKVFSENFLFTVDAIAEGILPLERMFNRVYEANFGKKPADMKSEVWPGLTGQVDPRKTVSLNNNKFPFDYLELYHPNFGEGEKKVRAHIQCSIELMRLEYSRKNPVGSGHMGINEDSGLPEPSTRPPEPANPFMYPDKCAYYIRWNCRRFCIDKRCCICCTCCILLLAALIPAWFFLSQTPPLSSIISPK